MKRFLCLLTAILLLGLTAIPAFATINGIFLGTDENGVNILNDRLRPGEDYYFPVLVAVDGAPPAQLTSQDLDRNRLEARVSVGGKTIAAVSVEEKNGLAYLLVTPGSTGTTGELSATLRINYRSKDSQQNITVTPVLRVGYYPMPDDHITNLDPGEFLSLDNVSPLVAPYQWEMLAKLNDYREVTLQGMGWRFAVNTANLGKRNMVVAHQPVMSLVQKYPDHQMYFLGFPGEPDFEVKGKFYLDVTDIADDYNHDFFLYRCAFDKVYPLTYEYDRDAGEIMFRPSQLSTYLVSDRRMSNIGTDSRPEDDPADTPPMENPSTGETPHNTLAATIVALVSLAGLGMMTCSKRR